MPVNYVDIPELAAMTLPKYLGRPGDKKYGIVSELASKDQVAGRLFRRAMTKDWGTGIELKFPLHLERSSFTRWAHAYSRVRHGKGSPIRWGKCQYRALQWGWYLPFMEMHLNGGEKELLQDIGKRCASEVGVDIIETLADALFAPDGNYAHTGEGENFLIPFGLWYAFTIDGLHVSGAGSVFDISPVTYPLWRNEYISPVAASDDMETISSIYELPFALDRMMRLMRFDEVDVWGQLAKDIADEKPQKFDDKETPKDLMILCDDRTEVKIRKVLHDRLNNVGYDQYRPRPTYKGLEFHGDRRLRIDGTYGYGYDAAGSPLWADRGGAYASGQWKGNGRCLVLNTRYYHVAVHPQHAPLQKKPYIPEGMFGLAHEGDLWLQTFCRSRRRAGGWIGPYDVN